MRHVLNCPGESGNSRQTRGTRKNYGNKMVPDSRLAATTMLCFDEPQVLRALDMVFATDAERRIIHDQGYPYTEAAVLAILTQRLNEIDRMAVTAK